MTPTYTKAMEVTTSSPAYLSEIKAHMEILTSIRMTQEDLKTKKVYVNFTIVDSQVT
jgi:hypothetical protein